MNIPLSIIIPAYNEEKRLGNSLKEISGKVGGSLSRLEIIVVDDGSVDRTVSTVCPAAFFNLKATGWKGAASWGISSLVQSRSPIFEYPEAM